MTRQEYNIKIAKYILKECKKEEYKDLRFHQLLFNLGINEFSEQTKEDLTLQPRNIINTFFEDKYQEESKTTFDNLPK